MVLSANLPQAKIYEAGSLSDALEEIPAELDMILLDIQLPGLNGVDGIAFLKRKWPQVPVLMLSSQDHPETVRLAMSRGAAGFISKADTADKIISLIHQVLRGEYDAQADMTVSSDNAEMPMHLTTRQCEVLELVCQGMSNKLIARKLGLSENTVRGHVQAILGFLNVNSRSEAAFAARTRGLVG